MELLDQISKNTAPGREYVPFDAEPFDFTRALAAHLPRLIAFYLPQFHAIPENDAWWGKGFTEWTNVTKAVPRFAGHYQPRLPGELGFYDLHRKDVLREQARLMRHYGVTGLCFHFYWFAGQRLLETPLTNLLQSPEIDLPFCINWANENWSRRWDGFESDILMAQQHSAEDDLAFAAAMLPFFHDPRYIRVGDRPLLMLYRPNLLPDAAATIQRWREFFRNHGISNPYITMVQGFDDNDPRRYGIDAAVGFPPHNGGWDAAEITRTLDLLDKSYRGKVVAYQEVARRTLANQTREFRLLPGVCPGWDNEARKPGRGFACAGATPEIYGAWLEAACRDVLALDDSDERIVFINAWNEWAEGAHLEPDRHFGYAFLAATSRALQRLLSPASNASGASVLNGHPPLASAAPSKLASLVRKLRARAAEVAIKLAEVLRP